MAKNNRWALVLITTNLLIICWVMVRYMTSIYPMMGHDYRYFLPSILDSILHFRINGLSIQWFTPSFGGGLPAYPNPQNVQFSLWTALTFLVQPLDAVVITAILFIVLGANATYYLFHRVLDLHWTSSLLGMVFFTANGFIIQRLAVGHLTYHLFPLISIFLLLLMDKRIHWIAASLLFALLAAFLLFQGSYFLIAIFGLSFVMLLPLLYIFRTDIISLKRIVLVIVLGGGLSLLLSLSKISAVYSFMRFFPRQMIDVYNTSITSGLESIFLQLLGTMNLYLGSIIFGYSFEILPKLIYDLSKAEYFWWEFDMSLSPVVFGILLIGFFSRLRNIRARFKGAVKNKKWAAWILLFLFSWLTIEFCLAKGLVYPFLQQLPVLSSLHVNPRFTAAFLLPLVTAAVIILDRWARGWSGRAKIMLFSALNITALVSMGSYFLIDKDLQERTYDASIVKEVDQLIRSGDPLPVEGILDTKNSLLAMRSNNSTLLPYEPIFGYELENLHLEIQSGSIWMTEDGYFNLTNPVGYVFPGDNATRIFERFQIDDREDLIAFASRRQLDWKFPWYQKVSDWISVCTFLGVALFLVIWAVFRMVTNHHTSLSSKR